MVDKSMTFLGIDKPSQAVRAMIAGLKEAEDSEYCEVEFLTFGFARDGVCFGCAATYTLMSLSERNAEDMPGVFAGHDAVNGSAWNKRLDCDPVRRALFESAIDHLRAGYPVHLFRFFDLNEFDYVTESAGSLPALGNSRGWKEGLSAYETYAAELEAVGA